MSLKDILRNIYIYADILQAASSTDVIAWNGEAIDNAFKWATYCEEVYKQSVGKPYHVTLAKYVQEIGALPWGFDDVSLELDSLQFSTSQLHKILVNNPYVKKSTLEYLEVTSDIRLAESSTEGPTTRATLSQSALLLKQVFTFHSLTPERQNKCRSIIDNKLSNLLDCSEGRVVLLTSLSTHAEALMVEEQAGIKLDTISQSQGYICDWLMEQSNHAKRQMFSIDDLALQRDVSCKYFRYYRDYVRHLVSSAEHLIPSIDEKMHTVYGSNFVDEIKGKDYTSIKVHLQTLTTGTDRVAMATRHTVLALTKHDAIGVWARIVKEIGIS